MLREVIPDGTPQVLGLLVERCWQIVSACQKTLVRIHEQLVKLVPGGYPKRLSADIVAKLLRSIRPTDPIGQARRELVKQLLAELRVLDRKRKAINTKLDQALDDYGTRLLNIDGIGRVAAAASSGEMVRYRLNLGGQREINKVLHTAAKLQIGMPRSAGRDYLQRKLTEGRTRAEASRSLKRHLSNAVYRALLADLADKQVAGEDRQVA